MTETEMSKNIKREYSELSINGGPPRFQILLILQPPLLMRTPLRFGPNLENNIL